MPPRKKRTKRDKVKKELIALAGGGCKICGYNRSPWSLTFHHRVPHEKEFSLSDLVSYSAKRVQEEAKKCDLLCQNCHMELHERYYYSGSFL